MWVPDLEFCFLHAEDILLRQICRLGKATLASSPHLKWQIFKHIFQILRASLAVAHMAVCMRVEDLQRALHTFQSGVGGRILGR